MQRLSTWGLVNLLVTYIVWGSTYLAIRVAVRDGAGWGPFWMGASRVLVASVILLLVSRLAGQRVRPTRRELAVVAASGLLMWVGGNGAVNWAEQHVASGLVALLVGAMPLWVAAIEAGLDRRPPSFLLATSLLIGFAGLVVLTAPLLADGLSVDVAGVLAVIFGSVSWGVGSILLHRRPVATAPTVTSGWQQLFGGLGFVAVAAFVGEAAPAPSHAAWLAWGYLVVFGSLLAFTSFVIALRELPTTVVMTYTYVNPMIAVALGWVILAEPVTRSNLVAMALIVAGVVGVFRDRARQRPLLPSAAPRA